MTGTLFDIAVVTATGAPKLSMPMDSVAGGLLLFAALVSAYTDIRWRRIYNAVTYSAFACLMILNGIASLGWGGKELGAVGFGYAFAGAMICLAIAAIPYITNTGGAGDAKLGAVIGAALGIEKGIIAVLVSFIVAGVLAVVFLIWNRGPLFVARTLYHRIGHFFVPLWILPVSEEQQALLRTPFPMAPSFLIGIAITSVPFVRAFFE